MNIICKLFGHSFKPVVVKQEKTIVDEKTQGIKWSSIVICPRCGEEVHLEAVEVKEDE